MKTFIQILLTLILFTSDTLLLAQENAVTNENKIEQEEIRKLIGKWNGQLTYLDYNSGKPYSMPCDLIIKEKRKNQKLVLEYIYPNEPKANSKSKITFSKERNAINKAKIVSKTINSEGQIELFTENSGKDGNDGKKATIRNIYKIGDESFIIRKEVQFEGTKEWILRNEYSFQKG